MYDIIVCGSNTVDAFLETEADVLSLDAQQKEKKLIAFPVGAKLPVHKLEFHIGGGGTNVCATFSAQKLKAAYIGKVGRDTNGHKVFEWLKEHKIDFLGQVGGTTGFSVVLDSQIKDRTILAFKGANNELDFAQIPQHLLKTRWFYGSAMRGQSHECLEKLFIFMHNHGVKTAYNPNSVVVKQGIDKLKTILKHVDVLIINKEEAQNLVDGETVHELARKLSEKGPSVVAITDGAQGVTVLDNEDEFHIPPSKERTVVETTGAGDAFGSGFVTGLVQNKETRIAAQMGVLNAESVIAHYGTKNVLTQQEMRAFINKK